MPLTSNAPTATRPGRPGAAGTPARGPEWTVQLGESYVRELADWLATTASAVRLVRYAPAPDCYSRGEDPLLLVRQLPAIDRLLVRMPPVADLAGFDEFHCDLEFVLSTRASLGELTYLLRYVPDETEVAEVGATALLAALEPPAATALLAALEPPAATAASAGADESTVDGARVKDRDAVADSWFLLAGALSTLSAGSGHGQLMSVARSARTAADLLGLDTAALAAAETAEQARDALRALLAQQMATPTATYHPDPEPPPTRSTSDTSRSGSRLLRDAPLRLRNATATVTGTVEIEEVAELVGWLRGTDRPEVDLRHATHLHAAAVRALVAFGATVSTPPVDPFLVQHVLGLLPEPDRGDGS